MQYIRFGRPQTLPIEGGRPPEPPTRPESSQHRLRTTFCCFFRLRSLKSRWGSCESCAALSIACRSCRRGRLPAVPRGYAADPSGTGKYIKNIVRNRCGDTLDAREVRGGTSPSMGRVWGRPLRICQKLVSKGLFFYLKVLFPVISNIEAWGRRVVRRQKV